MSRSFLIIKNVFFIGIITSFFIYMIFFLEKDVAEYNNALESGGYLTLNELNVDLIKEKILYVKDTLPKLDENSCYCEWLSNGTYVEEREYIIQIGDGTFIGVKTDDMSIVENREMEILAKIERMGNSQYEFYRYAYALVTAQYPEFKEEYRDFYELPDEIQKQFQPYILVPLDEMEYVVFPRIMQFVFVLLIIVAVTNCIYNIYRDDIRIWFKNKGKSSSWENEKNKEKLDSFLNNIEDLHGVKCNKEFLYGQNKKNIVFVEAKDIQEIQLRKYVYKIYLFIPIGVEWDIVIILNDEDTREISVGGKKRTQEVFDYILHNLNFKEERISDKYVKVIGRP